MGQTRTTTLIQRPRICSLLISRSVTTFGKGSFLGLSSSSQARHWRKTTTTTMKMKRARKRRTRLAYIADNAKQSPNLLQNCGQTSLEIFHQYYNKMAHLNPVPKVRCRQVWIPGDQVFCPPQVDDE